MWAYTMDITIWKIKIKHVPFLLYFIVVCILWSERNHFRIFNLVTLVANCLFKVPMRFYYYQNMSSSTYIIQVCILWLERNHSCIRFLATLVANCLYKVLMKYYNFFAYAVTLVGIYWKLLYLKIIKFQSERRQGEAILGVRGEITSRKLGKLLCGFDKICTLTIHVCSWRRQMIFYFRSKC